MQVYFDCVDDLQFNCSCSRSGIADVPCRCMSLNWCVHCLVDHYPKGGPFDGEGQSVSVLYHVVIDGEIRMRSERKHSLGTYQCQGH